MPRAVSANAAVLAGRIACALFVAGVPLLVRADALWEKKPFPNWSREVVLRVLTNSPWAGSETQTLNFKEAGPRGPETWKDLGIPGSGQGPTVQGGSPVGGIGAPKSKDKVDADINVRWSSALPIRRATALTKFGREGIASPAAKDVLAPEDNFYVLEISGVPAPLAFHGTEAMQAELHRTVRLITASGRSIPPDSVYVEPRGVTLNLTFRFSKDKPITEADRELRLRFEYSLLKVDREWKLKEMVYEGKLEL